MLAIWRSRRLNLGSCNAPPFNALKRSGNWKLLIRAGIRTCEGKDFLLKKYLKGCRANLLCDPNFFLLHTKLVRAMG